VVFSGLPLCVRREEAVIQPTLEALNHPAVQFGFREIRTRQVAKKQRDPCHLFKTRKREGDRVGEYLTYLYKVERLWEERVCSEGRPGTSTATSSKRRTISCG
jgi:hypothetical protein